MKKAISFLVALTLVFGLFSITAFAGGTVAKIGAVEYDSIDAAVTAAVSGDTIEVLADDAFNATLLGTGAASKSLTFTGEGTLTVTDKAVNGYKGDLTFDGVNLEWNGSSEWIMFAYAGSFNVTNGAAVKFVFDSTTNKATTAIYSGDNAEAKLNVVGGSSFEILATNTSGITGAGIQVGENSKMNITVSRKSTFIIDGTNRGYTNSPSITVTDSTFSVVNCTSNASNGGAFSATNSTVDYCNNAALALSASELTLDNTVFTSNDNAANGIVVSGNMVAKNGSKITVTGNKGEINSKWTMAAGILLGGKASVIDSTCELLVSDNNASGVVVKAGAALDLQTGTITDNKAEANSKWTFTPDSIVGGGIYNNGTVTVAEGVVICNNTAEDMGDDIYNADGATITLPAAAAEALNDCDDNITGWFEDGETRWNAHGDGMYINEYAPDTFEGFIALKAAHGEIVPEEVIIEDETPLGPAEPPVENGTPDEKPADKPVTPSTVTVSDKTPLATAPNTADETPIALFATLAVLGVAGTVITSKKNED